MKIMKIYKVECDEYNMNLTAVVACEKKEDAIELSGFNEDYHANQKVIWIGDSIYSVPTLICQEST